MSIIRRPRTSAPFTTILNAVVEDVELSAEALGLLVYLVGKPDNWEVSPTQLKKRFNCGRDRIYRIINELIVAGYVQRGQSRQDGGRFDGDNYLVSDEKLPLTGNPDAVGAPAAKPTQQKKLSKKETSDSCSKAGEYTEIFETQVWAPYPRKTGTSKKKAFDHWRMLNDENQARVIAAIPLYAAQMKREGRTEDKIKHLEFWLSGRVWETMAPAAPASVTKVEDWHRTATREQWGKILRIWSGTNDWRQSWGPEPGKPGCSVPIDMVAEHNIKHRAFMFSPEQLAEFQRIVDDHKRTG